MNKKNHEIALFRLMVLGELAARARLERGDVKKILRELAGKAYSIPYSKHTYISVKTIERWYHTFKRHGFDGLLPKRRADHGNTKIPLDIQEAILTLKKDNPARSLDSLMQMLSSKGLIAHKELSRASLHRFLQKNNLSKRSASDAETIERRSFEALHAGDLWQGDVMHGSRIQTAQGKRKVYLVSLMDDASRLITHSAFCFGETAVDIEGVLKQALLKRGIPKKIIIDNGAAYRAESLQLICARLGIRLVYCKPYEPQGKGKLERFHRTFRQHFLSELILENVNGIDDLNARLWAWLEEVYHRRPHSGLSNKQTPIERWRQELTQVQSLGHHAQQLDDYFCHRVKRLVKKDGSVSWNGQAFEVPYALVGRKVFLVVDPHEKKALKVTSLEGEPLGSVHPLDKHDNLNRQRQRPSTTVNPSTQGASSPAPTISAVEQAYQQHQKKYQLNPEHFKPLPEEDE